jgi:hypothetical protein
MADETLISWADMTSEERFPALRLAHVTDAVRLIMLEFVAFMAKRHAIVDSKPEFRVIGKMLEVVRPKVSTFIITTLSAAEPISLEDRRSPRLVLGRPPVIKRALPTPMAESIMGFTASGPLSGDLGNSCFGLWGVLRANTALITHVRRRKLRLSFVRVVTPLKGGHSPFGRNTLLHACARSASGRQAVIPARVSVKAVARVPFPARPAPFLACINAALEIVKGQSGFRRDYLHCTNRGLCHG